MAQSYFLNGTAQAVEEDCYQLTGAFGNQNGTVWHADFMDLNDSFDLSFTMNFGNLDATGADGMVFVLQDVGINALGESGGALGFNGFDPSFGIEFDTWLNGQYGDLSVDHIGFISNGSVNHAPPGGLGGPIQANAASSNIEDGEDHPVRVIWDAENQIIAVYFDCTLRLAEQIDLVDTIFNGQSLVYWGFTGSTGGSWNIQSVCLSENIIATGPETVICPGASTTLNVVGLPNATYTWDPPTFLSDPESATTTCTPDSTITYTVSYQGFCDALITDSITVFVEDLEASASASPNEVLTCTSPLITLHGNSNFPSGVTYLWETEDGNILSTLGPQATADTPGTYTLTVNGDDGVCSDTFSIEIVSDFSVYEGSIASSSLQLDCENLSVELIGSVNAEFAIWEWVSPGNATYEWLEEPYNIEIDTPGTWSAVITNPTNGCVSSVEIEIIADFTEPVVEAGYADTLTCGNPASLVQGVLISPEGYSSILEWSWEDGSMITLDPENPIAYQPGMYYLFATFEENGCSAMDSVWVYQDPEAAVDASTAILPNVISPNGDGRNDRFIPFLTDDPDFPLLSIVASYDLQLFNRWGNLIYSHTGSPVEWDGRIAGDDVSEGTYYYSVKYLIVCGGEQHGNFQGTLEVVR